ncbi:hypothetical protein GCM10009637_04900 [Brevibacterium luteolum]
MVVSDQRRRELGNLERKGEFIIADLAKRWQEGSPIDGRLAELQKVNADARRLRDEVTVAYMRSKQATQTRPAGLRGRRTAVVRPLPGGVKP